MKNLTYIALFALISAACACKTNRGVIKPLDIGSLKPGMSKKQVSLVLKVMPSSNASFNKIDGKQVMADVVTYDDKASKPPKTYLLYFRNDSLVNWHDNTAKNDSVIEFTAPKK